jgi:hypothetical protein
MTVKCSLIIQIQPKFYPKINEFVPTFMGVWQRVAMDSLKCDSGLPCPTLPCPAMGHPLWPFQKWPACMAVGLRSSSSPLDTTRRTPMVQMGKAGRRRAVRRIPASVRQSRLRMRQEVLTGVRRGVSKGVEDGCRPSAIPFQGWPAQKA